jgi:hypothetical protein
MYEYIYTYILIYIGSDTGCRGGCGRRHRGVEGNAWDRGCDRLRVLLYWGGAEEGDERKKKLICC